MIFKPHPLSAMHLPVLELEEDRKSCRKIGPCGVGNKAIYLNSFYIDRCYYIPFAAVRRVFKRVAMSKGGFPEEACLQVFLIWLWNLMMDSRNNVISNMKIR